MIPNILHQIWLGPRPLSELAHRCEESWKRHLPGWTIRCWNDGNAPLDHPYAKRMLERGLWAFASDHVRLQVLLREGGLYLDTDVELIRPPGQILEFGGLSLGLLSLQNRLPKCSIGTSWISAPPGCRLLERVLAAYEGIGAAVMNNTLFTQVLLPLFSGKNLPPGGDFDFMESPGIRLYHPDFFNPVEQGNQGQNRPVARSRSVAIHHAVADWGGPADPLPWWRRFLDLRVDRKILRPVEATLRRFRSKAKQPRGTPAP